MAIPVYPVYPVYPSDLNDAEWALLAPLIPPAKPRGRPRSVDVRRIVNGIFYVLRSGCAWVSGRYLPRDYGPWQTVYWYFRQWRLDGTWAQIHARLRELARLHAGVAGRDPTPSAAIIDSQSVKTLMGGMRGYDGHQQVAGRKRHILVDTEGFLLSVVVHPANLPDRKGGQLVLDAVGASFPRLQRIWADQGYTGSLQRWAMQRYGLMLDVVYPHWAPWAATAALCPRPRRGPGLRARVPRAAEEMGGGAYLFLAGAMPPPKQGLRTPRGQR